MEDKNKYDADFKDFDEEETASLPSVDDEYKDLNMQEISSGGINPDEIEKLQSMIQNKYKENFIQEDSIDEENLEVPNIPDDETQSITSQEEEDLSIFVDQNSEKQEEVSKWEKLGEDNSVVKKYIVYISKDFVPYMDSLTVDERTAYINDAIQMKFDSEDVKKQEKKKRKIKTHLFLTFLTVCIMTPIALLGAHKAIMLTFENYKYSQDNFEKLFKQRFQKNKTYMRSLQYNKEYETKKRQATDR